MRIATGFCLAAAAIALATPAFAAPCGGDFQAFLDSMAREAQAAGISRSVIDGAFAGVTHDPAVLACIEQRFGVPPQVLVAIWGLETDYGVGDMGKLPVFRVLATLAHDCRRTELFQRELLAALQIVQ